MQKTMKRILLTIACLSIFSMAITAQDSTKQSSSKSQKRKTMAQPVKKVDSKTLPALKNPETKPR